MTQTTNYDELQAKRYHKIRRWLEIADAGLLIALLLVLMTTDLTADLRDLALKLGFQSYFWGLLFYLLIFSLAGKALGSGFAYYGYRLEKTYKLSNQKIGGWLWDEAKGFAVNLLLMGLLAELLYAVIRWAPQWWWIAAWALFTLVFIVLAQLAPVVLFPIFYSFEKLRDDELSARLLSLAAKAGARVRGVYLWKLSKKSNKANAALAGLGATRRIVISDTLLSLCTPEEVEAVMAHELGHHKRRHILLSMSLQTAFTFLGFWVLKTVLRQFTEFKQYDFANLPVVMLTAVALSLLLLPLINSVSRAFERQADRYALEITGRVEAFISAMQKLAAQNLAEADPSPLVVLLFHSHPPVKKRVAAARQWAKDHPQLVKN